jgi:hypothetical protein
MFSRRQAAQNAAKSAEGVVVPVVQARSLGADVLADVAARYGVTISAGARAVAVPRGAAGQVWRLNGLASLVLVQTALVVDGDVVVPGGAVGAEAYRKGVGRIRAVAKGPRPETVQMHARLRGLHAAGMTDLEMAQALDVNSAYVGQVRRVLGLAVNDPRDPGLVRAQADTAFMARVRAAVDDGCTLTGLCELLGMSPDRVRGLIKAAGLVLTRTRRRRPGVASTLDPHKDKVLADLAAGVCVAQIAKGLGVRRQMLHRRLVRWGVKPPPVLSDSVAGLEARNAQIRADHAAGVSARDLARQHKVHQRQINRILKAGAV